MSCTYFQKHLWLYSPWAGTAFVCLIHMTASPTKILLFRCFTHIFNYLNMCILFSQNDLFLLGIAARTSWKLAFIESVQNREFVRHHVMEMRPTIGHAGQGWCHSKASTQYWSSAAGPLLGVFCGWWLVSELTWTRIYLYVSSPRRRPAFEHGSWLQSRAVSQDDLEFCIILQQLWVQMLLTLAGLRSRSQHPSQIWSSHWLPVLETLQKHYSVLFFSGPWWLYTRMFHGMHILDPCSVFKFWHLRDLGAVGFT